MTGQVLTRVPSRSRARTRSRAQRSGVTSTLALVFLVLVTVVAFVGSLLTPFDPQKRVAAALLAPSWSHPFGTDDIGRDQLSRVLIGVRLTWLPGLAIIAIGLLVGGTLGLLSGALGGWTDRVLQRLTDLFLVLPTTLIAIAVVAAFGPGLLHTVIAISIFWWPWYSRVVRSEVRSLAVQPHVESARLSGSTRTRLLLRYLLPGAGPAVLVAVTLDVANVVLALATLSFLGLGAPAPSPELGAMTARNLDLLTTAWWVPILPALVVFTLALAASAAGDGLRDRLEV